MADEIKPADVRIHVVASQSLAAQIDKYAAKLEAKTRVRVSRNAAARSLIQIGLERALDERAR